MSVHINLWEVREAGYHGKPGFRFDWALTPVGGKRRRFSHSGTDKDEVIAFRVALRGAASDPGRSWDLATGLPRGLTRPTARIPTGSITPAPAEEAAAGVVLLDVLADLRRLAEGMPANTLKSEHDDLASFAHALLRPDAPPLSDDQRAGLRAHVRFAGVPAAWHAARRAAETAEYTQRWAARAATTALSEHQRRARRRGEQRHAARAAAEDAAAAQWGTFLHRHGLRWSELDEHAVRTAVAALELRTDGSPAGSSVRRRMVCLTRIIGDAVRAGRLTQNPLHRLARRELKPTTARVTPVATHEVIGLQTVLDLLDAVAALVETRGEHRRHVATIALSALAALRPEEARGFDLTGDLIPAETAGGWGHLRVHQAVVLTTSGTQRDGQRTVRKGTKTGQDRTVPACPALLERLTWASDDPRPWHGEDAQLHVRTAELFAAAVADLRAAGARIPDGFTPRLLRHSRLSHQMATGLIPDKNVAAWAGHSVGVLQTYYLAVIAELDLPQAVTGYLDYLVPPAYRHRTPPAADPALVELTRQLVEQNQQLTAALAQLGALTATGA